MTLDEFKLHFARFRIEAMAYIKASAPYRTGRLKANISYRANEDGFSIIIDIDYMQYTEEAWTFNSRWNKTLTNPNYKWLQSSVERLTQRFANNLKGVFLNVN